ncbi:MAG TPA: V-type ATPase 116kDa subunit family protein, partial [Chlamydiales bacterium]|nr:V-type ATPase 116kDa subunit family protein [Chlamydiales bacterium]
INRVYIFGDFSIDQIKEIESQGNRCIQFFAQKQKKRRSTETPENLIYLGTEFDMDYYISISKERVEHPGMIELHIQEPLGVLQQKQARVKQNIKSKKAELQGFAPWKTHLQNTLIDQLNQHNLHFASSETTSELDDMLFAVEAWIPTKKLSATRTFLRAFSVHCESVPIAKTDLVPTYLENEGFARVGEDLVDIYDTPSATDSDPSPWVFWAFVLFFSMIVADGGYGFIYLIIAFFLRRKFKKIKGAGKRFLTLLTTLAVGCIIWGVLTCSYFGVDLNPSNPIKKFSLIGFMVTKKAAYHMEQKDDVYQFWTEKNPNLKTVNNPTQFLSTEHAKDSYPIFEEFSDNILLELAIFIGLIHLSLSLLRYLRRSWSNIGWVCFMIGGYLYFPSHMDATSLVNFLGIMSKPFAQSVGLQLVSIGIVAAVLLAIIQMRLGGLAEITKVIQVFSDTLSYLRLYALA